MDFDPCSVEKPGLLPPEVILALPSPPLQTALALPDPGLAPPEPDGYGYDHGLPPSPPTSASEGEEEDDRGQFKQKIGCPVDIDPCSVEKPGLLPPEVILAQPRPPLQTALALPDPGLAPPEPEGYDYDHDLPPYFSSNFCKRG